MKFLKTVSFKKLIILFLLFFILLSCIDAGKMIRIINSEISQINAGRNQGEEIIPFINKIIIKNKSIFCYNNEKLIAELSIENNELIGEIKSDYYYFYNEEYSEWGKRIHKVMIKFK